MATEEQKLDGEQRELVAVAASVGAGCHPCVSYHVKAATKAGLTGGRLLGAVTSAERVAGEAAERMAVHARTELGTQATDPVAVSPLDDALASLGAALAANDLVNIEGQMLAAARAGASQSQLQEALEVAQNVQQHAARIHFEKAVRLLETSAPPAAASGGCDDDCPCHADASPDGETAAGSAGSIADNVAVGPAVAAEQATLGGCGSMLGGCADLAAAGPVGVRAEASLTTAGAPKEA